MLFISTAGRSIPSQSTYSTTVLHPLLAHCCLAPCKSVTNYGPLTEPKFYIVKSALTQIPTSNGHISETKRRILYPLVPKFFSRRGLSPTLSWKWRRATLSPSFGLFRSEKPLFWGVPGGSRWVSLVRICPQDHFPCRKKKNYSVTNQFFLPHDFVISFVEIFALIFTQTAWKPMYIGGVGGVGVEELVELPKLAEKLWSSFFQLCPGTPTCPK